ncbi:hypothetical protein [Mycobacteroides saopaulense]|uniref:Uncharacterized protein n=1 Tax=Mycobacteroides saopaulense TaxID=1578165 RepID=A0ABX3BYG5_9MYCO|nr:hypothetical protein [Mycobacteroides saopaulense]OHT86938.1 hypothetical protein BKG68_12720 [Mycobacteroides saopaulense]OHU08794.1 hypothetical protein BKG73_17415 [Mycobacteroides saopaulense]
MSSAYYSLFISDYVNDTTTQDYASNWDEAQGKAAAFAADHGYRMELHQRSDDHAVWWLSQGLELAAIVSLERQYSDE